MIKWKDYPSSENTWERAENLKCDELVQKFEEAQSEKLQPAKQTRSKKVANHNDDDELPLTKIRRLSKSSTPLFTAKANGKDKDQSSQTTKIHVFLRREFVGQDLGFDIDVKEKEIYVSKIDINGLAHRNGNILINDKLTVIDGEDVTKDLFEATKSSQRTYVRLVVERGHKQPRPHQDSEMFDNDIDLVSF